MATAFACGGNVVVDGAPGAGATTGDAGEEPPIDAGLAADANPADCRSIEGIRLCGTHADCFAAGPTCTCVGPGQSSPDAGVPEIGWCLEDAAMLKGVCGYCVDGDVCVNLPAITEYYTCASESMGRILAAHGRADLVTYADGTPYTGAPIPAPASCPAPLGDVDLCGGNCGGCGPGRICSGRSPTHPWGICVPSVGAHCTRSSDCDAQQACLFLSSQTQPPFDFPSLCVSNCTTTAPMVPGGATCN